jgi:hypothetical protein
MPSTSATAAASTKSTFEEQYSLSSSSSIFHENANDVMALLLEQIGGDSGINAAGQADDHAREFGHVAIIP